MNTLADIPLRSAWLANQRAHLRIQVYAVGATHELLNAYTDTARAIVLAAAGGDKDKPLTALGMAQAKGALNREWAKTFAEWNKLFNNLRREVAGLPIGVLALYHAKYVVPLLQQEGTKHEARGEGRGAKLERRSSRGDELLEAGPTVVDAVFRPQLGAVLDAANQSVFKDGLRLSQRIWNLGNDSRETINRTLYGGVAQGKSAWDVAKDLEANLGAGRDCPRWTRTRLYSLTKKQIAAGDTRGLLRAAECDGRGVAYNALRMARTEISRVHALATDAQMERMPWVEKVRIVLSKQHPVKDICDEMAKGGEGGQGIYPKGKVKLPPYHPHCLCGEIAVQQDADEFAKRVRGWMRGEKQDAAMDTYARQLGQVWNVPSLAQLGAGKIVSGLVDWLWADADTIAGRLNGD